MADDINKRRDALQAELNLTQEITNAMKNRNSLSNKGFEIQRDLISSLSEQKELSSKIEDIDKAIGDLLLEQVERGQLINQHYITQLNNTKKLLEGKQKEKDLEDEINDTRKSINDELMGSLGTMGDMLKAGTALGASMALFKGLTNQIGSAFKNTIGFAADLNKELGMSGGDAMYAGLQNLAPSAMFSRYSIEELNQATKDFAETMGTSAGLTNDLRNSMAEMTSFGVGGPEAAKLAQSFESANGSAVDMTTEIKEMSKDAGVLASKTFKDLASQQRLMVGMSKEEIKLLAKKTIEINKQGLSLSDMHGIADSMMDIESTMKAQAKARVMLQGQLSKDQIAGMQSMTAAALEYQRTGDEKGLLESIKQTNMSAEKFKELGPRGQEIYAQSIGLSADKLAEMIQKQEQAKKIEESGALGKAAAYGLEMWERVPGGIKEATTGLIAYIGQMALMNMMQGKGTGLGNLNPFKKKGGSGGDLSSDLKNTNDGGGDMGKASQGAGGGLKSLAEGLREMGDGKVFAGIGAVALAGPAFIVALPSIPFLLFMGKVKLKQLEENFGGLGRGLAQMPQGILGALTMAIAGPALALGMLAIPFLAFMSIPSIGPIMQTNFTALAAGLTAFGNPATAVFVLIGIGLMAALGAAMIPFAYALSLLSPLVEAFGNIIVGVFAAVPPIIEAVANGFVTMMSALTPEAIMGLMLLGPALLLASVGMVAFSAAMLVGGLGSFFGGGIIDDITELAMIGPQLAMAGEGLAAITTNLSEVSGVIENLASSLTEMGSVTTPLFQVAAGLYSIAGGLMSVSMAGLLASPAIGGLIALAAVAPMLESIGVFGGGDNDSNESTSSNSNNNKELINEIKGLRSDIQSQPILINVDGKTVSRIARVQRQQGNNKSAFNTL